MTRDEVLALAPGKCLVGVAGIWDDELRIIGCGPVRETRAGKAWRGVTVAFGPRGKLDSSVTEGGREILTSAL